MLEASAKGANLSVRAVYEFDYDGMMKITWDFAPQGPVSLKNMTFDIPLRKEYGKYLCLSGDQFHWCPGRADATADHSGCAGA